MYIGIDLGGHTISAAAVSFDKGRAVVSDRITARTPVSRNLDETTELIASLIRELYSRNNALSVGIAVPAFLDRERFFITKFTNFSALEDIKLPELVRAKLLSCGIDIPVYMENDANCAALGEGMCGAAQGLSDYIVLTLGTGVGSGIVVNGKLLTGAHGMAGEAGHIIAGQGKPCPCGGFAHLEGAFSADALERLAAEKGIAGDFRELWEKREFEEAKAILVPALDALGRGIATLYSLFDPELIVISGGMSRAEGLYNELVPCVERYISAPYRKYLNIKISELTSDAAVTGAASAAAKNTEKGSCL